MKKIIYTIIITTTFLFSCSDQLDRIPIDDLAEDQAFKTVSDLQNGLRGFIGNLNLSNTIGFNSIFTDNCRLGVDNGGQQLNTINQILDAQTGAPAVWANRYKVINDINRLLAASTNITPSLAEVNTYNNILAQSHAFRAYAHHELLLYYGLDVMNPSAPGVPYQEIVSDTDTPSRLTTAEVAMKIEADLALASSLLPSSQNDINFVTQDFITFLRARMALYTGDYANAITLCTNLINDYPLANTTQYSNMFNGDSDTTEVIFKYDNVQGFNFNIAGTWIFTGTGGNFVEMSAGLRNLLSPNDVRSSVLLDPSSSAAVNIIGKYPPGASSLYINDFKAMRISEIYLIRAEAYARSATPQFNLAAADVNAIRVARFASPPPTAAFNNEIEAITGIKAERRLELAYEGHRYIDAKRYKNILNIGIERDPSDCPGGIPCTVPVSSNKFILPIPQAEINANTNITQAPGY